MPSNSAVFSVNNGLCTEVGRRNGFASNVVGEGLLRLPDPAKKYGSRVSQLPPACQAKWGSTSTRSFQLLEAKVHC